MKKKNVAGILFLPLLLLFWTGCSKSSGYGGSGGGGGGGGNANTVTMKNNTFSNANLQVATGTLVTWINNDAMTHTVTADNGSFDSGDIAPGGSFRYTFTATGTYSYYCRYHAGMTGRVTVVVY